MVEQLLGSVQTTALRVEGDEGVGNEGVFLEPKARGVGVEVEAKGEIGEAGGGLEEGREGEGVGEDGGGEHERVEGEGQGVVVGGGEEVDEGVEEGGGGIVAQERGLERFERGNGGRFLNEEVMGELNEVWTHSLVVEKRYFVT